jgi:LPXTG-site transpeptidase (sortase) family protein
MHMLQEVIVLYLNNKELPAKNLNMAQRSQYNQPDEDEDNNIVVSDPFQQSLPEGNAAADLIRQKVAQIYKEEPSAAEEINESTLAVKRSKHQQYMYELNNSGKDLATIQTQWHDYYTNLEPEEKYKVWQEFYDSQSAASSQKPVAVSEATQQLALAEHKSQASSAKPYRGQISNFSRNRVKAKTKQQPDNRQPQEIQASIKDKITAGGKIKARQNIQSLMFGLGMGLIVIFVFLFGFFNEVLIAPFIQPSRADADTPIILNSTVAPTQTPEVIIPKINVEIPVDYNETSTNEANIENDLEDGVVHYPTTVQPGQLGNAAFFGHSSNNIFNKGKYKFAFVLLHTLVKGDTFYLTYNDKVYVYKVVSKTIVSPNDINVLNAIPGQTATATLITCDPPGTSINRLIVVGQQISPDPSTNTAATTTPTSSASGTTASTAQLPGNGPTLWQKFYGTKLGKVVVVLAALSSIYYIAKRFNSKLHLRPV